MDIVVYTSHVQIVAESRWALGPLEMEPSVRHQELYGRQHETRYFRLGGFPLKSI